MSDTETMTGGDGSATLAALSDTERATWQMTGELPTPAAPVTEPDDDEPEPSPATEKPAAAVATPEKPISKRQQHINDLARGKAEAEQRAAAAERERDELRASRQAPPREVTEPAKPKPVVQAFPTFDEYIAIKGNEDADWYAYSDARDEWNYGRRRAAERAAEAREAESRTLTQHEEKFATEREVVAAELTDFDAAIAAVPKNSISLVMSRAALEAGPRATYWLATHPKERAELTDDTLYVDPNGPAFKGAVGLMRRHLLSQVLAPRENGNHDSPTTSTSASAGPAAKTVTTAPVPPVTLSARSGDPADPLDAALKDRDFRRYEAEANARDLAGSKR